MDEVFKELDSGLCSDWLNNETNHEKSDVRTELKELFGRFGTKDKNESRPIATKSGAIKDDHQDSLKSASNSNTNGQLKKAQKGPLPDDLPSVKTISDSEQHDLDQAIARAKELADQAILELDGSLQTCGLDSPRTPGSPTRRSKFTFKFKTQAKEHKSFSDTLAKHSEQNVFDSILSDEAKQAYETLIEKGAGLGESDKHDSTGSTSDLISISASTANLVVSSSHDEPSDVEQPHAEPASSPDSNPLRMLRNGVGVVPKVRGNRSRFSAGPQTASLARLTATASRSSLPAPPPIPKLIMSAAHESLSDPMDPSNGNLLPLPPRDRSKPLQPLKQHERKHPLLIGSEVDGEHGGSPLISSPIVKPLMSTFKPNMPLRKPIQIGESKFVGSSTLPSSSGPTSSACTSNSSVSSPVNTIAITANTAAATGASLKSTRQLM